MYIAFTPVLVLTGIEMPTKSIVSEKSTSLTCCCINYNFGGSCSKLVLALTASYNLATFFLSDKRASLTRFRSKY